jgi:putative transcriptional regulator
MPIIVTLDEVLHSRRMTLTELAGRVGITVANLSILKTGKARGVRFSTLSAICKELRCQPGDLLAFELSEDESPVDGSPADGGSASDTGELDPAA